MADKYDEDFMGYVPGNNFKFETLPVGTYDYVVHGIVGLGLREKIWEGKKSEVPMIKIIFEIPDHKREDGQTELLTVKLKVSENDNSHYYKFCASAMGLDIVKSEVNMRKLTTATGMKELLGKTGTLTVAQWENKDGRSVSPNGFYPLHHKITPPKATRDFIFFNPYNPDLGIFKDKLSWRQRKEIMEALNAKSFSEELWKVYEECKKLDEEKMKDSSESDKEENKKDTPPWNFEAIQ